MNHNDPSRVKFRSYYENCWWKTKLYNIYYPNVNNEALFHKWASGMLKEAGFTKNESGLVIYSFLGDALQRKENRESITNLLYPYTKFLLFARQVSKDDKKLTTLEVALMRRALVLIKEIQVCHLNL